MTKTTVGTSPPDDVYEEAADEAAKLRTENTVLKSMHKLLQSREEEATFIRNSSVFMAGYRMAMGDILSDVFNVEADLGQDMDEPDRTEEAPF